MAKARMLHKSISTSSQVNKLSLPARLLFTWLIPHADDEGRLKGDPEYVKALVVPMINWPSKKIKQYLEEIKKAGLIYYWQQNSEWFIEFVKWKQHQTIREDRRKSSILPSFSNKISNQVSTRSQPDDTQKRAEANINESNRIEVNKSEYKDQIADNNSFKKIEDFVEPNAQNLNSKAEVAAYEVWRKLELGNPAAFRTTYLPAARKGLPASIFYQFASEIKQDPTIRNRGAIFSKKVEDYINKRQGFKNNSADV